MIISSGRKHLPHFQVAALMVLHVASRSEALPTADRTLERALVAVDPQVHSEVLFLTKGLEAALDGAFEWLSPVVKVQMRTKSCLSTELFGTVSERADEGLRTRKHTCQLHWELLLVCLAELASQ